MNVVQLKQEEQKSKMIGYGVTIGIHGVLFLLLWWAVLKPLDPPLQFGGMELSMALGEEDMGGPSDIPVTDPASAPEPVATQTPDEQTVTQDVEEVDVVAKPTPDKKDPVAKTPINKPVEKPVTKPIEKPRVADTRALFKKSTTGSNDGGHGAGSVPGNEGNPDGVEGGSPDGNGIGNGLGGSGGGTGTGDGTGDGMGFSLAGRKLSRRPDVTDNSRETGTIVVSIVVDRTGKVTRVQLGQKGTTTLNPTLLEKARQGAMDARFSPKPDGPEEQYGTMTFVFRFKQ